MLLGQAFPRQDIWKSAGTTISRHHGLWLQEVVCWLLNGLAIREYPAYPYGQQPGGRVPGWLRELNLVHVLVVGRSDVTCIVMARIVERSGLRSTCTKPDAAAELLAELQPDIVVLDGGADNRDCDSLMEGLVSVRGKASGRPPAVLLLSNRHAAGNEHPGVHAVVAKPITPERVQPVILRMAGEILRAG